MAKRCAYGWPVQCGKDAVLEVYDFKKREAVPACAEHAGSVVIHIGRACMVRPTWASEFGGDMANRNPHDRRERNA